MNRLFIVISLLLFLTIGCIENNNSSTNSNSVPNNNPTPDNVLRVFTDTVYDKPVTLSENSHSGVATLHVMKDDKVTISISDITGGNRDVDLNVYPSKTRNLRLITGDPILSEHVSRGKGTYSFTAPSDLEYSVSFINEDTNYYKELDLKIDITYTSTEKRNWGEWTDWWYISK